MNNFFLVLLSASVIFGVSRKMCRKVYAVSQMSKADVLAMGRAGYNLHCTTL